MLSKMRYLFVRERTASAKVHKRIQNKKLFMDEKDLICSKTHKS